MHLRRAIPGDEPILRALRLQALSDTPDALVSSVLAWASTEGALVVRLAVIESNVRGRRCYERNGFRDTGHRTVRERDGVVEMQMERRFDSRGPI